MGMQDLVSTLTGVTSRGDGRIAAEDTPMHAAGGDNCTQSVAPAFHAGLK